MWTLVSKRSSKHIINISKPTSNQSQTKPSHAIDSIKKLKRKMINFSNLPESLNYLSKIVDMLIKMKCCEIVLWLAVKLKKLMNV